MIDSFWKTIIIRFLIGGTILASSTMLANLSSPLLAGIVVTVPLELVSLFFVHGKERQNYALCILIMSIATVIPVLYYFSIMGKTGLSPMYEVASSFAVWFLCCVLIFMFRTHIIDNSKELQCLLQ